MIPAGTSLVAFLIAVSFAAGLNLYATVATLGLLARVGWVTLPPELHMLASMWVIIPAVALFLVEVLADRIPFVGLAWNVGHLLLRPPLAALLAYQATAHLSPALQLSVAVLSALIAAVAHSSKTATRVLAAEGGAYVPSFATNGLGDGLAIAVVCGAARHPVLTAAFVLSLLVLTFVFLRLAFHAFVHEAAVLRQRCSGWWKNRGAVPSSK